MAAATRALLNDARFADLTIVCERREFKVHRAVICAVSDVLARECESAFKSYVLPALTELATEKFKIALSDVVTQDLPEVIEVVVRHTYGVNDPLQDCILHIASLSMHALLKNDRFVAMVADPDDLAEFMVQLIRTSFNYMAEKLEGSTLAAEERLTVAEVEERCDAIRRASEHDKSELNRQFSKEKAALLNELRASIATDTEASCTAIRRAVEQEERLLVEKMGKDQAAMAKRFDVEKKALQAAAATESEKRNATLVEEYETKIIMLESAAKTREEEWSGDKAALLKELEASKATVRTAAATEKRLKDEMSILSDKLSHLQLENLGRQRVAATEKDEITKLNSRLAAEVSARLTLKRLLERKTEILERLLRLENAVSDCRHCGEAFAAMFELDRTSSDGAEYMMRCVNCSTKHQAHMYID